jgi:hypothetical protein
MGEEELEDEVLAMLNNKTQAGGRDRLHEYRELYEKNYGRLAYEKRRPIYNVQWGSCLQQIHQKILTG